MWFCQMNGGQRCLRRRDFFYDRISMLKFVIIHMDEAMCLINGMRVENNQKKSKVTIMQD